MRVRGVGFELFFRYPKFGKMWLGNVISEFGDQAGWIALTWLLLHRTGSASSVGWITLLYQFPSIFTSPLAGLLLDRFPRARVMAIGNLILTLLFTLIALITLLTEHGLIWLIYILIGLAGVVLPLNTTGGSALLPELVPANKLSQANYLIQMEWQLALILGPAIGGVLIGIIGTQALILADAATFLFTALMLFSLPVIVTETVASSTSPWRDFQDGIRYLMKNRSLVALTVLTVFFNLLYGPYEVILPFVAKTIFHNPSVLGLWWTVFAIGSIAGSAMFSMREWRYSISRSLAFIIVMWGVVTTAIAFSHTIWVTASIMLVAGIVFSPWGALVMTVRQKIIPPQLQGRVIGATMSFTTAGMPIGAWITGFLLGGVSSEVIFLTCGLGTIGVGIVALLWPSFREIDRYD